MKNGKKTKKGDNTVLVALLGLLGVGGAVGLFAWARSRSTDAAISAGDGSENSSSGDGKSKNKSSDKKTPSLAEVAAQLRVQLLTLDGCSVGWKLGEASRTALLSHHSDFFIPAIADARSKGLTTTDEVTAHAAGLLVPGCAWPPKVIRDFDIEAAVAGQLPVVQEQMWAIAQALGAVQVYLALRSVIATSLLNDRRG